MNKKLMTFVIGLIAMFFCVTKVSAFKCEYFYPDSDQEDMPDITFEVTGDGKTPSVAINLQRSKDLSGYNLTPVSNEDKLVDTDNNIYDTKTVIYKLYANASIYEESVKHAGTEDNGACPEQVKTITQTISHSSLTGGIPTVNKYIYIYVDDLTAPQLEESAFLKTVTTSDLKTLYLKDYDPEMDADKTKCTTYDSYMRFLEEDIAKTGSCEGNSYFTRTYQELNDLCDSFRSTSSYMDEDDPGSARVCSVACSRLRDDVALICDADINTTSCNSLGNEVTAWLFKIIRFLRYAIPALLIVLSILDFIKAIASDSDDEMKKVTSRFTKRLIAAALIFLIPFVLDFILRMFNIPGLNAENPFCAN